MKSEQMVEMIIRLYVCGDYFLQKNVFQHTTIESLLRECRRNSQLRQLCGLQSHYISMNHTNNHVCIVPSSAAMSRFIKN